MFGLSDSVSLNHMHSFLGCGSSPNKIYFSSINDLMDHTRKKDVLHDMIRDISKTNFG